MTRQRLDMIRKIGQKRQSPPSASEAMVHTLAPPDPSTYKQIQSLRQLGLSVSDSATPQKIQAMRNEFDLVDRYVRDVWCSLLPDPTNPKKAPADPTLPIQTNLCQNDVRAQTVTTDPVAPSDAHEIDTVRIRRFVAMLFGDGQLISRIATVQRARQAQSNARDLKRTTPFKHVARLLRDEFGRRLPKQSWWTRLLDGLRF